MSVTMKVNPAEERRLIKALRELGDDAEDELSKAINATGLSLRGSIVKKYRRGPATGIVYEKYNPRRTHQASAAGEAPATDTGRLADSVTFDRQGKLQVEVSTDVEYGPPLEFGTRTIEPRPNWVPSIQEEEPKYKERLNGALEKATRKVRR